MKQAELKLHRLFSDGMVLQRDKEIQIKGEVNREGILTARLGPHQASRKLEIAGPWQICLPPLPAGGPHSLELSFEGEEIHLKDILIGDVWLCSGQSNMQLTMARLLLFYPVECEEAEYPEVRFFNVPENCNFQNPRKDFYDGSWLTACKENLDQFSGVAWYFARELQKKLTIPIGIISSAVGGTPIQSWMSEEALQDFPADREKLIPFKDPAYLKQVEQSEMDRCNAWYRELGEKDPGLTVVDFSHAKEVELPGNWDGLFGKEGPGTWWFQKEVELPEEARGRSGTLWLGVMVDSDRVWINGTEVGNTAYQYPPRIYPIPEGLLNAGKNTITVQLTSNKDNGLWVEEKNYRLDWDEGSISLEGIWQIQRGASMPPLPDALRAVTLPAGLFNGMIAPLESVNLKGVVWYQGESNVEENQWDYGVYLRAMLKNWRAFFKLDDLPCLITQLPLFNPPAEKPQEDGWAFIRQAQLDVSREEYNHLTVTLDLGEWNDIHPLNKKMVGKRLAETALNEIYDEKDSHSSAILEKILLQDQSLTLQFSRCGTGLKTSDGLTPGYLFVKDKGEWKSIEARCQHDKLILPYWDHQWKELSYAWADNPKGANLINSYGTPLSPFNISVDN